MHNEIAQLRATGVQETTQVRAESVQRVDRAHQDLLALQDELAQERAQRQTAERLWAERFGNVQNTSEMVAGQTTDLDQRLRARDEEISGLRDRMAEMIVTMEAMRQKVAEWEEEENQGYDADSLDDSWHRNIPLATPVLRGPSPPMNTPRGEESSPQQVNPIPPPPTQTRREFSFPPLTVRDTTPPPPVPPTRPPQIEVPVPPVQQPFSNVTWRPKEPPTFGGKHKEDVHSWSEVVTNYFRFMNGSAVQEVAYAATLLREHAHTWWQSYLRRNHGRCPRDWPTMAEGLVERFGSRLRDKQALADIVAMRQYGRPVAEYAAEFENSVGKLSSSDEATLLQFFIWGLDKEMAEKVATQKPLSLSSAISIADELELAIKFAHRPPAKTGSDRQTQQPSTESRRGRGRGLYGRGRRGWNGRGRGNRGGRGRDILPGPTCYGCGGRGHIRSECPTSQCNNNTGHRGGRGAGAPRGRGRGQRVGFAVIEAGQDVVQEPAVEGGEPSTSQGQTEN